MGPRADYYYTSGADENYPLEGGQYGGQGVPKGTEGSPVAWAPIYQSAASCNGCHAGNDDDNGHQYVRSPITLNQHNHSMASEEESEDFGNFCQRVAASIG
eukprot:scaffold272433_cov40-Prasinocladus_malaysianus.AAC.1